ncbi:acyltransferase family protein [Thermodesulfobacteriota bacterium]
MNPETEKKRIWVIDAARFYGIGLVYYGHLIERIMYLKNPAAAVHYKFIYSFHMLLFFVLAGYIAKESALRLSFGKYLKHRLASRLIPYLFFTGLMMVLTLFIPGDFFNLKLPSLNGYLQGLKLTVFGLPVFNVPTWFLLCLFSVELVHFFAFRLFKSDAMILLGAAIFYIVGYAINWQFEIFNPLQGKVVGRNYLYIHEAVIVYSFYLLGIYLKRRRFLMDKVSLKFLMPGLIVTFLVVLFTYRLNRGPFIFFNSVVIMMSSHGNFFLFPLTAVAGSLFIFFLAGVTPKWKAIGWMGQNALILFCLNGIFYHFINGRAAQWIVNNLPGSPWVLIGIGTVITLASLAFCIPLIYLFNKTVPQLVGQSKMSGPLLKNLI